MIEAERLVDHHCHGLILDDLDRAGFESHLNEGTVPAPHTTFFDSMLGLALRRWCPPVLDLPAYTSPEDYLARRRELGGKEASRRLLQAAGIAEFLVDTGLTVDQVCPPKELAPLAGGAARSVVRLEALAEDILRRGLAAAHFADEVREALIGANAVAAKSIAAYRVGLDLPAARPGGKELRRAVEAARGPRLAHPGISGWLAWTAIEAGLPLQIHVGYGDRDLDLLAAEPLRLTPFLRATEERGVPVLLLHNYPFHRHAAYLAQVYAHVYLDVGLATHNAGALSRTVLTESLEVAPFGKLLFSTDAYGLAELYLLGATLFRRGLAAVLEQLMGAGELTTADAEYLANLVGSANARRVYSL